jgi:hypothetical protein
MPTTKPVSVKELKLDLNNFRTVPQSKETDAVHTMISIAPDRFWALAESLLDGGYLPTENIIVLKSGDDLVVKEGNRRIGALKLILGYIKSHAIIIPENIDEKIKAITADWKSENEKVPCAIYDAKETEVVDKIVTLAHGKGDKASRDKWESVATARHNREKNKASEPALDLLEKYLLDGKNLTPHQKERWSGAYYLTVLKEAMNRIAPRLGFNSTRELVENYPAKIKYRMALDNILRDIGIETLGFKEIRDSLVDFQANYGIPAPTPPPAPALPPPVNPTTPISPATSTGLNVNVPVMPTIPKQPIAVSTNNPKNVIRELKKFYPRGSGRSKVVTLLDEARKLKLDKHPHAFCFLLRSMFEISAKAYCNDHTAAGGPSSTKADGNDRALVDVLRDIHTHLTKNKTDKLMIKELHGAMAELATQDGILSVTSLNQLVHNPKFTVDETHISSLFGNIFPLLQAMNR